MKTQTSSAATDTSQTPAPVPVPVTLITGFLGSGKTTLLNRILESQDSSRIAVIQNEFGEISIDHELVLREEDGIFEMQNGCLCCTVRDDLLNVLEGLKKRRADFDRIIIETSGLADPVPVAQTFFSSILIQQDFRLDGVITMADAKHLSLQLGDAPEARQQLLCADLIILNKTDLVTAAEVAKAKDIIRGFNREAPVLLSCRAEVNTEELFNISLLHPDRLNDIQEMFDRDQKAHQLVHLPPTHDHEHDESVSSYSLEIDGEMDLERLDAWLSMLQILHRGLLYRMKGILNLPDEDRTFVFQSVFSVLQGNFGRAWKTGEKRRNRFVFIGKNLNRDLLNEGFRACLLQKKTGNSEIVQK